MVDFRITLNRDLIMRLDAECMPGEEPPEFEGAQWFVSPHAGAYCAWKPVYQGQHMRGFLYRSGVRPIFRGKGLQREMIRLRERCMASAGLTYSVTYTDADNAASMRSLMACGYKPYTPTEETCLSGGLARLGRVGFVHWIKGVG